jgi:Domain of unknown function (DUF4340)
VDAPLSWRVTVAFVAAVAILAGIVVGLDRFKVGQPPSSTEATQAAQIAIFNFDDQKVTVVELKAGDKDVRLKKDPETKNWSLADTGEPANSPSVTSLVFRMASLKANSRVAGSGADLQQFGLDPPKDQLTAELDDGSKPTLLIGGTTPIGTGAYAKSADADDVYVISTQLGSDLERLANDPKAPPTPTPRPPTPATTPNPDTTPTPAG